MPCFTRLRNSVFLYPAAKSYSALVNQPWQKIPSSTMFEPVHHQTPKPPIILSRFASDAKSPTVSDVKHSADNNEFTLSLPSMPVAYLKYREIGPKQVDMYTTVVPKELEGRGIAKLLAVAAFNFAVDNDVKMKLTCWYLAGYLERNPNEKYLKQLIQE